MRTAIRVLVAVIALVAELRAPMAAGATAPVIVHPNWRLVARGDLPYAVADDRYVVIAPGNGARLLTLIDEQSGRVKTLAPPNCSINSPADQLQLGGPWLMVGCGVLATLGFDYLLYDISSGQWRSFAISARCPGFCRVAGIGRHWAKILSNDEVMAYSPDIAYLQDIDTGRFIRDPVTPGGRIYDDLNAPSGSASLCSPLRYPTFYPSHTGPEPGLLAFYGKFVLVSDQRLVKTSLGPVPGPSGAERLYTLHEITTVATAPERSRQRRSLVDVRDDSERSDVGAEASLERLHAPDHVLLDHWPPVTFAVATLCHHVADSPADGARPRMVIVCDSPVWSCEESTEPSILRSGQRLSARRNHRCPHVNSRGSHSYGCGLIHTRRNVG